MTTSICSGSAHSPADACGSDRRVNALVTREPSTLRHTVASRLVFLTICVAVVTTTLAFGSTHDWALAAFALSATALVCLWGLDGLMLRSVQISINPLQWPLLGMILLGLIKLLPLR